MAICVRCKKDKDSLVMMTCHECIEKINKDRFKDFDFEKEFGAVYSNIVKNRWEILDIRDH